MENGPMECWTVAFSPCGTKIISGSNGGKIHVYNVETGQKEKQLDTHGKYVLSIAYVSLSTYTNKILRPKSANMFIVQLSPGFLQYFCDGTNLAQLYRFELNHLTSFEIL